LQCGGTVRGNPICALTVLQNGLSKPERTKHTVYL
jgi:hypothetical protein